MALGYFLFDIWPKGSVLLLLGVTAFYLLLNLSWGLLVSAGSQSPDQAVQTTVLIVTPQLSLSGFVFPIHSMPDWARWLVELVPFAHFLRIIRGIYLTGAGLADIWPELLVLLGFLTLFLLGVNRSLKIESTDHLLAQRARAPLEGSHPASNDRGTMRVILVSP
jgi:ABC-2 type transport system permease protein